MVWIEHKTSNVFGGNVEEEGVSGRRAISRVVVLRECVAEAPARRRALPDNPADHCRLNFRSVESLIVKILTITMAWPRSELLCRHIHVSYLLTSLKHNLAYRLYISPVLVHI